MCGIAGYRAFGSTKPTKKELEGLLVGIMSRGSDATGVAFVNDGRLKVIKAAIDAKAFVKSQPWSEITDLPNIMIMHARFATQGSPQNNMNNHPVFNKRGMALVHNGQISNDTYVSQLRGIKTDAEVDSEIILRVVESGWWNDVTEVEDLRGPFACAMIWDEKPEELILFRHSNPIVIHMDKKRDILFWASTAEILRTALSKYHRGFLVGGISTSELRDDNAILLDATGIVDMVALKPCPVYSYHNGWDGGGKTDDFFPEKTSGKGGEKAGEAESAYQSGTQQEGSSDSDSGRCPFCHATQGLVELGGGTKICSDCIVMVAQDQFFACPACKGDLGPRDIIDRKCPYCYLELNLSELEMIEY